MEGPPPGSAPPRARSSFVRRFTTKILWSLLRALWAFFVPLLRVVLLLSTMGVMSVLGYYLLHRSLLSKALLSEPLYFDFSLTPPLARVSLLSYEKQWFYIKDCLKRTQRRRTTSSSSSSGSSHRLAGTCASPDEGENGSCDAEVDDDGDDSSEYNEGMGSMELELGGSYRSNPYGICGRKGRKSFLRSESRYTVDVKFGLATSPKNMQHGKFMVTTTIFDTSGDAVAKSSRPVVVPYQSQLTLVVDAAFKYPMRALGFLRNAEVMDVHVPVMNDFKEPKLLAIPSPSVGISSTSGGSSDSGSSGGKNNGNGNGYGNSGGSHRQSPPSSRGDDDVLTVSTTEYIELELSTADIDMDYSELTIMPLLSGVAYYMYYFPYLSFFLGVTLFTGLQFAVVLVLMVLRYISIVLFQDMSYADDDGGPMGRPVAATTFRQRQQDNHQTGQQRVAHFLRPPATTPSATGRRDAEDTNARGTDGDGGGGSHNGGEEAMLRAERLRREEESRRRRMRRRQQMLSANLT